MNRDRSPHERVARQSQIAAVAAIVVMTVWTGSAFAAVVTDDVIVLEVTTPIMLIVVGYLFGFRNGVRKGGGDT